MSVPISCDYTVFKNNNGQVGSLAAESRFVGPRRARSEAETPTTDGIDTGIPGLFEPLNAHLTCTSAELANI